MVPRNLISVIVCWNMMLVTSLNGSQEEGVPEVKVLIREIESSVDHNHCTTRQFQHKTFFHDGVWFVFYSDGRDFWYQTSVDWGRTWRRAENLWTRRPMAPAVMMSSR
ncbi:hypothetical protein ACFL5F_05230 [Planctomycetota bacterium]